MKNDRSIKYVRKARLGQASADKVPKVHAEARDLQGESRIIAHLQIGVKLISSDMFIQRLTACIAFALLASCAVLDPNNIIGRRNPDAYSANSPSTVDGPSIDWRRAAFEYVWNTINEKYYDPALHGVDWRAARGRHEPRIMAAVSDDDYWDALDRMAGELKDSHTRVNSPKRAAQERDHESHSLGIGMLELDGELIVSAVNPQSDAWWVGVRPGMAIKTIDNEPAMTRYRRLLGEARDSSTPWARTRGAIRAISAGELDSSVTMTFTRHTATGSTDDINATIKRRRFRAPPESVTRVLPSGYGYLRFSGFAGELQSGILAAVERLKVTPGIIVDLRGNGGGSLGMANTLLSKFLPAKTKGAKILTRTGQPIKVAFITVMKLDTEIGGEPGAYAKPLVILINDSSASASEIFAGTLQELGRATVIGSRTCGCLLGYLGYADLPGGGQLAYSEVGFVLPKGTRIEGNGVKPDIEIPRSREDILFNRDRALEAAEVHLRTEVSKK